MQDVISKSASGKVVTGEDSVKIKIFKGEEVLNLLSDKYFGSEWDRLFQICHWSTVFQSRKYATAWYSIYKDKFLPVLLVEASDENITGIFAMARDTNGLITGAGEKQAEYHAWLTHQSNSEFIGNALTVILEQFPGSKIEMRYVPGTAPIEWINTDRKWSRYSVVRKVKQPIISIDGEHIKKELKKKNRKEKINRLKRMGKLSFERIKDVSEFVSIFDQLAWQYDFRKEAMFNSSFFKEDPLRKEFLIAMFNEDLLHATVLKLNEEIIASNVAATDKKWLHLQGINSHDPFYGKYSPGILHLLLVCNLLAEEGAEVFDLTPGTDIYKDSLATDYVTAYHIIIGNSLDKLRIEFNYKLTAELKSRAYQLGINLNTIKQFKRSFLKFKNKSKAYGIAGLFSVLYRKLIYEQFRKNKKIICIWDEKDKFDLTHHPKINSNSLANLLDYTQEGLSLTRWEFLEDAMRRLERGERSFTWSKDGVLQACVWLSSSKPDGALPADAAVLQGLYIHSKGSEELGEFQRSVAFQVSKITNQKKVYIIN